MIYSGKFKVTSPFGSRVLNGVSVGKHVNVGDHLGGNDVATELYHQILELPVNKS